MRRERRVKVWFAVALFAPLAHAHHSISAMYARENSITLEGQVVRFEYRNPHPVIHLEVVRADGGREEWVLEWSNKARLDQRGYHADTLKPGDRLQVTGGPARNGSHGLFVGRLFRPADGLEYVSSQRPPAAAPSP